MHSSYGILLLMRLTMQFLLVSFPLSERNMDVYLHRVRKGSATNLNEENVDEHKLESNPCTVHNLSQIPSLSQNQV